MSGRRKKRTPRADAGRSPPESQAQRGWGIEFFRRVDKRAQTPVPGRSFLDDCPTEVRAELLATLTAVRDAPPPAFSGGLRWHAMHGDMNGWYEARTKRGQTLYRLFCILDRNGPGLPGPSMIIVTGGAKPNESAFSDKFYASVRRLGDEYRASNPRSIAR